jgi:hypothetical protein
MRTSIRGLETIPRSNGLIEEEGPWKAYVQQSLIKASIQWVF